jgi:hypothetical protein
MAPTKKPKKGTKKLPVRNVAQKARKKSKKKQADNISNAYKKAHGHNRARRPTVRLVPCVNVNTYHHLWPPAVVTASLLAIETAQILGHPSNTDVETLGEKGAKWWLCQELRRPIEDGDMLQPIQPGRFYTFNGPNTIDIFYISDLNNNHVYVLEAKGTQAGAAAGIVTRASNNKQGTSAYLDEVAVDMANSGLPRKMEAAAKIQRARLTVGCVVRYVGVHTTYDWTVSPYSAQVKGTLLFDLSL